MSRQVYGSVTIRRLPSGDTVHINLVSNKSLVIYHDGSSAIDNGWSGSDPAVITPNINPTGSSSLTKANFTWKLDGVEIAFGQADANNIRTSADGKFKLNAQTGALQVCSCQLFTGSVFHDLTLTFSCMVYINGGAGQQVTDTIIIQVKKAAASTYDASIIFPDAAKSNTELYSTGSLLMKADLTSSGGAADYTVSWYIAKVGADEAISHNGSSIKIDTGNKTLEITQEAMKSWGMNAAHIVAHYFVGGVQVASAGQTVINHDADYSVVVTGETQVGFGGTVTLEPMLMSSIGGSSSVAAASSWAVEVQDTGVFDQATSSFRTVPATETVDGQTVTNYTFDTQTGVFAMDEAKMYYNGEAFDPVVVFEATI